MMGLYRSVVSDPLEALSLPVQVALAAVAVFGYLFGRYQRTEGPPSDATRRELKRARAIVNDLEQIAHRVRRELAQHHNSLAAFKHRVSELSRTAAAGDWKLDSAHRVASGRTQRPIG